MAIETVAPDVFVEAAGYRVTATVEAGAPARRGGRPAADSDPARERLRSALREADFAIAAELEVAPAEARAGRRGPPAGAPQLSVAVGVNESAVLLLEAEGGVFTWQVADARAPALGARRGGVRSVLLDFRLGRAPTGAPAGAERRGPILDWLGEKLLGRVRVYVLRFVVTRTIDALVKRLEGDNPTGPVLIVGQDPRAWTPRPLDLVLPQDRPARILLMVHGTFSSTAGSFGMLAGTDEGLAFLEAAQKHYDVILGHDHHTLADDPRANAEALMGSLTALRPAAGTVVDAVAFSRGGLVYRILAEELLEPAGLDATIGRSVFVGCTNAGTNLAEPDNWADLVDVYTNAVMAAARGVALLAGGALPPGVGFAIRTLGRFAQMLSEVAISERRLPGLAAMEPDGAMVTALNADPDRARIEHYHAITSSFEPTFGSPRGITKDLGRFLADRITDRLFTDANDLVVDSASMENFGKGVSLDPSRIYRFGDTDKIYHTIYFGNDEVASRLLTWLDLAPASVKPLAVKKPPASTGMRRGTASRPVSIGTPGRTEAPAARSAPDADAPGEPRRAEASSAVDRADVERHFAERDGRAEDLTAVEANRTPLIVERHLAAEMEPYPPLDAPANVFVIISPDVISVAHHQAAAATETPVRLDATRKLTLELIPRLNCRLRAGDSGMVEVDTGASQEVVVRLSVLGEAAGEAELVVEARQGNSTVASFSLRPIFIARDAKPITQSQAIVASEPGDSFPVLRIYEFKDSANRITLRFDLMSDDPAIALSVEHQLDPSFDLGAYIGGLLAEIEAAWNLADDSYQSFLASFSDSAILRARALLPPEVRAKLWGEHDRIRCIQIVSDEALIPWELLCIVDPNNTATPRRGFLAEWGVLRWFHGIAPPPRRIGFSGAASRSIIPEYRDENLHLPGADEEQAMLARVLPGIEPIAATSLEVRRVLAEDAAAVDVLHFACHGEVADKAVLTAKLLMMGHSNASGQLIADPLSSDQVKVNLRMAPGHPRSLVFLNSCQTGRGGRGVAGVSGFADAFLRPDSGAGAAIFVGALWSIDDKLAHTFAEVFYQSLGSGKVLMEAVTAAREACRAKGDFTWLAYSVYGHPLARIDVEA